MSLTLSDLSDFLLQAGSRDVVSDPGSGFGRDLRRCHSRRVSRQTGVGFHDIDLNIGEDRVCKRFLSLS